MHYYTHNIGEFAIETKYMTFEQKGIYVDLVDHYLASGKPLASEWLANIKRLASENAVDAVLSLCFEKDGDVYRSQKLDLMIEEYEKRAEKNRENARKPRKKAEKAEFDGENGDLLANGERVASESLTTNNQELLTNNQEIKKNNKKKTASLVKPDDVSQEVFDEWIDFKKSVSRAKPSQRMIDAIVREAQAAEITTEKAMVLQMENGWQGFKAEYVKKESGNLFDQQKEVTADTITEGQVSFFANKLAYYDPMSKFSRSGESYQQFEKRLATNLRIPEHFEKYKPYLVQLGLLKN